MKILFVCHEYPPKTHGGIGSFTKLLAEKLSENDIEVSVIGFGEDTKSSLVIENGVKVFRLPCEKKINNKYLNIIQGLRERWIFYKSVKKYIKSFRPSIIETYEWSGPLIWGIKGAKLVVRLHGGNTANNDYMELKRNRLVSFYERRLLKNADFIIAVSNHIALLTQTSFNEKFSFKTLYSGVDTEFFKPQPISRDTNKILFVGRMHPHKGLDKLFAAMNILFAINASVHFDIVCGINEEYKNRLLKTVDDKFHTRINFLGRINNRELNFIYSSANLSVLPSVSEALGLTVMESMSCGTPVLVSDRSGAKEIINNDVDGFLISVLDPTLLANRINSILSNQSKIEEMRSLSRIKIVENFKIENVIMTNILFYKSIISKD